MSKNTLVKYKNSLSLFDELTRDIWNDMWDDPFFGLSRGWRPESLKETDKEWVIEVELPRVKRENITVTSVDKNTLKVVAKNDKVSYSRVFVTDTLDAENAEVKLEDGVLTIKVPKIPLPDPKVKTIEVK